MPFQRPTDHYQPFPGRFLQSNFSPLSLEKFERQTVALKRKIQELDLGLSFTVSVAACQQVPKFSEPDEVFTFIKE